jgi:hypothetical protein
VRLNDFPVLRKGSSRPYTDACTEGFQRVSGKPFGRANGAKHIFYSISNAPVYN